MYVCMYVFVNFCFTNISMNIINFIVTGVKIILQII